MVEINEIVDPHSLKVWLMALPHTTIPEENEAKRWAIKIAYRAAMRVLPNAWEWELSVDSRRGTLTALQFLRPNLMCGVASNLPIQEILARAAAFAYDASSHARQSTAAHTEGVRAAAAHFAQSAAANAGFTSYAVDAADAAARTIAESTHAADASAWDAIRADCAALVAGQPLDRIKLWHDAPNPLADLWSTLRPQILAQGDGWRFWVDWYDKALNGEPQDLPLLTKIALTIPTNTNKSDLDHVDGIIARMVEQRRLELEAERLQSEIARLQETLRAAPGMGHNNPPYETPVATQIQREITVIWAGLGEVKDELEEENPDPSLLTKIAKKLLSAAAKIIVYCGRKADIAIDHAAKGIGSGAGKAIGAGAVAYWASQSEQVQSFAESLLSFVRTFGG